MWRLCRRAPHVWFLGSPWNRNQNPGPEKKHDYMVAGNFSEGRLRSFSNFQSLPVQIKPTGHCRTYVQSPKPIEECMQMCALAELRTLTVERFEIGSKEMAHFVFLLLLSSLYVYILNVFAAPLLHGPLCPYLRTYVYICIYVYMYICMYV